MSSGKEDIVEVAVATATAANEAAVYEENSNAEVGSLDGDFIREQDRLLPIANVARIMKQAVPTSAKIAKDAKECVQECVSEFISFLTSEAAERCQQEKRKTVNGEDIIWAMETLGFDQYSQLMKIYLQRYKEVNLTSLVVYLYIYISLSCCRPLRWIRASWGRMDTWPMIPPIWALPANNRAVAI